MLKGLCYDWCHTGIQNSFKDLSSNCNSEMNSYHQYMLQQPQISSSTFIAITQSSHLHILADLWVISSLLEGKKREQLCCDV